MAYINGADQLLLQTILKGDSAYIRFSSKADGTDFTETWSSGQNYIGFATGQEAPTDKTAYEWVKIGEGTNGDYIPAKHVEGSYCKIPVLSNSTKTNAVLYYDVTTKAESSKIVRRDDNGNIEAPSQTVGQQSGNYYAAEWYVDNRIKQLKAELTYVPIDITSFYALTDIFEIGSNITSLSFTWVTNKPPKWVKLINSDDETLSNVLYGRKLTTDTILVSGLFNKDTTTKNKFTLTVTDEAEKTDTAETSIKFYNGVYYGVSSSTVITNATILGLTKILQNSRNKTFTVTANAEQYIYYCLPKSYGECAFKVGGFDGGFSLVKTFSFTNASGYTEDYYIYRSDNIGLGNTTVTVS